MADHQIPARDLVGALGSCCALEGRRSMPSTGPRASLPRPQGVEPIRAFVSSAPMSLVLDAPVLPIALVVMLHYSLPLTGMALALLAPCPRGWRGADVSAPPEPAVPDGRAKCINSVAGKGLRAFAREPGV